MKNDIIINMQSTNFHRILLKKLQSDDSRVMIAPLDDSR